MKKPPPPQILQTQDTVLLVKENLRLFGDM